jgi:hypothetical protein
MRHAIRESSTSATTPCVGGVVITLAFITLIPAAEPVTDSDQIVRGFSRHSSQMPENVATAYRAVFLKPDEEAILEMQRADSSSIALKAAWRLAELKCAERPDRSPLSRFLGFVEARTRAAVPQWWEACLLASRFDQVERFRLRPGGWPEVDERLFPIHRVELGDEIITVPPGVEVSYEGEWLVWKEDCAIRRIRRGVMSMEGVSSEWLTVIATPERMYVATGSDIDGAFGLACLTHDGAEVWRAHGWGTGNFRGGATGFWWAACEIRLAGENVLVFGKAYESLFVEAFHSQSGQPLYRFCTRYIEENNGNSSERQKEDSSKQ